MQISLILFFILKSNKIGITIKIKVCCLRSYIHNKHLKFKYGQNNHCWYGNDVQLPFPPETRP